MSSELKQWLHSESNVWSIRWVWSA